MLADIWRARKGSAFVSPSIVAEVQHALHENEIRFVVAPFEANFQLTYMHSISLVHAIISTDSDFWALIDSPCVFMYFSLVDMKALIAVDASSDLCWTSSSSIQACVVAREEP